jgi:hypothetical protein
VVIKKWNPQTLVNLSVTNVPSSAGCNQKTLGLQHLQLLYVAASSRLPDLTGINHHMMDEPLTEQHTISDGQATPPVNERSKQALSLVCLLSCLVNVC